MTNPEVIDNQYVDAATQSTIILERTDIISENMDHPDESRLIGGGGIPDANEKIQIFP